MRSSFLFPVNSSLLLYIFINLGIIAVFPVSAGNTEPWGTRSYEIEKPIYDQMVKKAEQNIRKAQHRKEQNRSQRIIILGDISGADYQEFEKWYNSKEGNRPPKLIADLDWTKEELDDARQSYLIYAEGSTSPDDPKFGADIRDSLWPAHLKMLRTQIAYYDLQAWDEEFRRKAAERYTYSLYVELFQNAVTGMQYVLLKHSEQFFADLADCAGRTIVQAVGGKLLESYASSIRPSWLTSYSGAAFGAGSIIGTGGVVMSCLDDATRNAIVNATINGIRFNFVSKVTKTWHVPEEIAEYWWSKMINPGDSEESPWAPQYRSMYDRVTQGAVNAIERSYNRTNLTEHAKDLVKYNWNKQAIIRITDQGKKAGLDYLKKAKKRAIKDGLGTFIQKRINKNAAITARKIGKMEVEKDVSSKWLDAADYAILAFDTTIKSIDLNSKKREFEAAATPIIDEYKRVVACLKKQEMSTSPQSVLLIYKLTKKQDVADFFARCDGKMSDQISDQILAQGQDLGRELYRLLELAREIHASAYPSCKSVLDATATLAPQVDSSNAIPSSDLASRLAGFRESVVTIEANAKDGAAKGVEIGNAKTVSEQIAIQTCQTASYVSRTADSANDATTAKDNTAANQVKVYSTTSAELLREIEALAQNTEMLATLVVDEAPILAAASRETAPLSTADMQNLVTEITENLGISLAAGEGMAKIASDARAKYDKQFAALAMINDDTADRLLVDSMAWLTEIQQLAKELSDCQGLVQSTLNSIHESDSQKTTAIDFISRGDIEALGAKAEAAVRELASTLDLAQTDDKVVQTAAEETKLCLVLDYMRGILSRAQSAGGKAKAACNAGNQMSSKATAQIAQLKGKVKSLSAEARRRNNALLKLEALANKMLSYRDDAKRDATSARRNQKAADNLAGKACRRLNDIKSAQSVNDVHVIFGEIQGAVSSCKSLAQMVRKSAADADGAASACSAIETSLSSMTPPAPLEPIRGEANAIKGEIDALDAVVGSAKNLIIVVDGARGEAKSLLAMGQKVASRLQVSDISRAALGEMGGIVNQIDAIYGEILACPDETRALIGELVASQGELQSSEQALSNTIRRINDRLRSGGFSEKGDETTTATRNYAEMAGWSADGMQEILVAVATCQAAAEKKLAQANAADAACAQRQSMKAIPNPSGAGWACTCINPQDQYNEQVGGCVDDKCRQYEGEFFGALMNNNVNKAQRILKISGNCGFANNGPGYIRQTECNKNYDKFIAYLKAKPRQLRAADSILSQSRDCNFAAQATALLNTAYEYQPGNDRRPPPAAPSRQPPGNITGGSGGNNNGGSGGNRNGCPPGSVLNGALLGVCVPAN